VTDLIKENLWTYETRQLIIKHNGSVQQIPNLPERLKQI